MLPSLVLLQVERLRRLREAQCLFLPLVTEVLLGFRPLCRAEARHDDALLGRVPRWRFQGRHGLLSLVCGVLHLGLSQTLPVHGVRRKREPFSRSGRPFLVPLDRVGEALVICVGEVCVPESGHLSVFGPDLALTVAAVAASSVCGDRAGMLGGRKRPATKRLLLGDSLLAHATLWRACQPGFVLSRRRNYLLAATLQLRLDVGLRQRVARAWNAIVLVLLRLERRLLLGYHYHGRRNGLLGTLGPLRCHHAGFSYGVVAHPALGSSALVRSKGVVVQASRPRPLDSEVKRR